MPRLSRAVSLAKSRDYVLDPGLQFQGFTLRIALQVTALVMKTEKHWKCAYCGKPFEPQARGRRQLYCKPSHRLRAFEERKLVENQRPLQKTFRLLPKDLEALSQPRLREQLSLLQHARAMALRAEG